MFNDFNEYISYQFIEVSKLDTNIILLVILLVNAYIVYDSVSSFISKSRKKAGIGRKSLPISVDGGKNTIVKEYISDIQGISGRPDAVFIENGYFIPVEHKPLSKKIHDRHVAQLLVYMRLIEEFEGKKPPYGYLILGPKRRRVKIMNADDRQAWVDNMLKEMRELLHGGPPHATPTHKKCLRCDVKDFCNFKF